MAPSRAEFWFRVVTVLMALEQLGLVAFGLWLRTYVPPPEQADTAPQLYLLGTLLAVMGIAFCALNLTLALGPRKPWVWIAGLTNLAAAVVCCPPGALLLLVWTRLDVRRHFGMPE